MTMTNNSVLGFSAVAYLCCREPLYRPNKFKFDQGIIPAAKKIRKNDYCIHNKWPLGPDDELPTFFKA